MLPGYARKSNIGISLGLAMHVLGLVAGVAGVPRPDLTIAILAVVGVVFFIYGCIAYMEGKGYSWSYGLLGLLGLIGLVILVCKRDRHPQADQPGITRRERKRAFLWGGLAGACIPVIPTLAIVVLTAIFGQGSPATEKTDYAGAAVGLGLAALICFVLGGLVGLVVQIVVRAFRRGPAAAQSKGQEVLDPGTTSQQGD